MSAQSQLLPRTDTDTKAISHCTQAIARLLHTFPREGQVPCDLVDDVSEAVFQWMRALAKGSGAADSFPAALVRACTAFLEALASADWEKFTAACSTISGCLVSPCTVCTNNQTACSSGQCAMSAS
jgi:hypothetical protein